jgi:amino acid adenylation domain-containing protein
MQIRNIQELLSQTAERFAANIAIDWNARLVSYGELERNSNRIANYIQAAGFGKGAIIAVLVEDRIKLIEAIVGILKAGCAFAPLGVTEPDRRLRAMIELVNPRLYVLESRLLGKLPSFEDWPPALLLDDDFELDSERIDTRRFSRLSDITDSAGLERQAGPDDMCYIYFTSGSTGTPKAIAGRFKSLAHFAQWEISELGVTDQFKVTQLANPTFDAYLRDIFVPLCSGATICIPEDRSVALDPVRLADWLDQKEITLMHCVPAVFRLMAGAKLDPGRMRSLKHIMMAGERLDPAEIKRWMDVFGERVQLINLYGATENTMAKFRHFITEADTRRRTIPIGKPIRGARAILVDEAGAVCDPGAIGEIYIRTPYLTLGYYNDPDLTRKVFAPNPFNSDPNDIVYKTGDYGRLLPDGNFELIGRKDQQVKIRGQRVELGEIEQALKRQPGVQDCAVRVWGDDPVNLRLAAYIARRPEVPSQAAELRSSLQAYLPDYMIPATFTFLDSLPLTSNGKVDRNALPPPDQSERQSETEFIAPRNEIEEKLAEIWREALQIGQAGRVGINDNFFHLGGHSLLATQVASRIRDVFQIDAPLRKVFEKPTIAELAAVIAEAQSERETAARTEALDLIERMSEEEIADALEQLLEDEAGQPVAQPVESSVARA